MPAATDLFVDYTNVYSAQIIADASINADDQHAFYLFSGTALAQAVLDLLEAAGVITVITVLE